MGLITPEEIVAKSESTYQRFLKRWVRGSDSDFFPYRVRARFAVDPKNLKETIAASERLLAKSKARRNWGYTIHREQVRTRNLGSNPLPKAITIDTLDDLLRLSKRDCEFAATRRVVSEVRQSLPRLDAWLITHVQSLHKLVDSVEGLVKVAQFFIDHPRPDCYARQIPVAVDTKFVRRHSKILRQWLDLLLPASAIDVNEATFPRRFGLRDAQPHRAIRVLDPEYQSMLGLPFDELSLPLRTIADLPVKNASVIILENDLNLLTLPPIKHGIAIRGEGNAVSRVQRLQWLHSNRVLYWGDIDVDGFLILSRLRNFFPHVESVLMDLEIITAHVSYPGNGTKPVAPTNLTPNEIAAFHFCSENNRRLEQEKICQPFVDKAFVDACGRTMEG